MKTQKGSIHAFLVVGLIVALLGALGFIFWQNFIYKQSITNSESTVATKKNDDKKVNTENTPTVKEGTISGSLTYPSESIPDDLIIYALNLDTQKEYFTKDHIKGSEYQYEVGYRVSVPEGKYHVYGVLSSDPQTKAYYNEFVKCGLTVDCKDYSKLEVKVDAGKETSDVTVGDWYNNQ